MITFFFQPNLRTRVVCLFLCRTFVRGSCTSRVLTGSIFVQPNLREGVVYTLGPYRLNLVPAEPSQRGLSARLGSLQARFLSCRTFVRGSCASPSTPNLRERVVCTLGPYRLNIISAEPSQEGRARPRVLPGSILFLPNLHKKVVCLFLHQTTLYHFV